MSVKIFLSTVSDEFRAYRDYLRSDLTRQNVEVKVQEDFKDLGGDTLDKLDVYIAHCDAVVHLVGDMTGSAPNHRDVTALFAKYPDLTSDLPPVGEGADISFTQWEAWLALYHKKELYIVQGDTKAERGPNYVPTDLSRASQAGHLDRLRQVKRYSGFTFTTPIDLANHIKGTGILDLLVKDAIREQVQRLTTELSMSNAQRENLVAELAKIKAEYGVTVGLVSGFLETMVGRKVAPEQFAATLFKIAGDWKIAGEKIDALSFSSNLSPRLSTLRDQAKAAHAVGQLDKAERLLAEIVREESEALQRLEEYEQEILQEIRIRKRGVADAKATQAAVAHARLNYKGAAALYGEAASLVEGFDPEASWNWCLSQAGEFYAQGDEFGENGALVEAIELYSRCLTLISQSERPLDWAATQNNLGIALTTLGERESGTARLEEAVAAYREALEEWTRERVPLQWAMTQNNLGNALSRLGERESGTARLEEAVKTYGETLKEYARERVPLYWAATQNNLGNALRTLGERESGTARLKEAVAAYREALKERTHERVPLKWARTQENLALAYQALFEKTHELHYLDERSKRSA